MLHYVLWPILAVWMGVAVVVLLSIVGLLAWGAAHLLRDQLGTRGRLFCPVQQRSLRVRGVPRRFDIGEPIYSDVRRCEAWGRGRVRCTKSCIHASPAAA